MTVREYILVVEHFEMLRHPQTRIERYRVRAYTLADAHALFAVRFPDAAKGGRKLVDIAPVEENHDPDDVDGEIRKLAQEDP